MQSRDDGKRGNGKSALGELTPSEVQTFGRNVLVNTLV